jgi:hypothetical protein
MKPRPRASHIWPKQQNDHYMDPPWPSERLFAKESFHGAIHDPVCGAGTIPKSALAAGFLATASDLVPRDGSRPVDFLRSRWIHDTS